MANSKKLVKKILAGNTEAFRTFINDYQRLVYHIVLRMIVNEQDREDICQDIFIKIYENLAKFKFDSKLSTWIARITYNSCINYLKKKKIPLFDDVCENGSLEKYFDSNSTPDDFTEEKDLSVRIRSEIMKLPIKLRTILTLYHLEEMSYQEIAKVMDLPDGTVKSYLFRARKLLKEKLSAKYKLEELWTAGI